MSELEELKAIIEELRVKLHKLAENSYTREQELLATSQVLDAIINKYYLLTRKNGC